MKISKADFERLVSRALSIFRGKEPYKSGNMKHNATKLEMIGEYKAKIYIDPSVAPYYKYTEFTWAETSPIIINAPRRPELLGKSSFLWNDGDKPYGTPKKNPNQGWTKVAMHELAKQIAQELGGRVIEWREG